MNETNQPLRAEGFIGLAERLRAGDVDGATAAVEKGTLPSRAIRDPVEIVPLAQIALLLGQSMPAALRAFLDDQERSDNEELSRPAALVLKVTADEGQTPGRSLEAAAYALLWIERAEPSLLTRYLLIESTLLADGHEAAQWLLDSVLDDDERSEPYAHLMSARCAFARRDWRAVIDSGGICVGLRGWIGRQAVSDWMKALVAQGDQESALAALRSLPQDMQSAESLSTQASLLWKRGERAAARDLWARALEEGWGDFDRDFAEAIGAVDWDPRHLVAIALTQSEAVRADVCIALAGRSDLPSEVFDMLMAVDLTDVRVALAGNPALSIDALRAISKAGAFEAIAVAANESIPGDLLAELASRPEASVRRAAASSTRCPPDVLEALARDAEPVVLMAVRDNPACPDTLRVQVALML